MRLRRPDVQLLRSEVRSGDLRSRSVLQSLRSEMRSGYPLRCRGSCLRSRCYRSLPTGWRCSHPRSETNPSRTDGFSKLEINPVAV